MTQLQNQDPSSPMDTNQFTSELVQFAGVEQQINTNTNLTQLIQLTQASELMQSAAMIGRPVTVQSDQMALQNGSGALAFTAPAAEPAAIAIYNDAGTKQYIAATTFPATRSNRIANHVLLEHEPAWARFAGCRARVHRAGCA